MPGRVLKKGFSLPRADACGSVTHSESGLIFLSRDCKGAVRSLFQRPGGKTAAKKTTFGADLIEGMELVLAHQRGKVELGQVGRSRSMSRQFASG